MNRGVLVRKRYLGVALAAVCVATSANAGLQTINFVHLATLEPEGGQSALYTFSFTTARDDFVFARVYFNLEGNIRYGCGVYTGARCTLSVAGQTLKLIGLPNGIQGSFSWYGDPLTDNRPTGIDIDLPIQTSGTEHFDSYISPPLPIPEPRSWALMLAGFGMLGVRMRRRLTFANS